MALRTVFDLYPRITERAEALTARSAPLWIYPGPSVEPPPPSTYWSSPRAGFSRAVTAPHGKSRYDLVLDIIRGYLVAEGKRPEGKHRTRRSI